MPTLNLTDAELAIVRRAVSSLNDIENDMMLDGIESVNIFADHPVTYAPAELAKFRTEIYKVFEQHLALRMLLSKLGIDVNSEGYTL